jgi:hypothetical protein
MPNSDKTTSVTLRHSSMAEAEKQVKVLAHSDATKSRILQAAIDAAKAKGGLGTGAFSVSFKLHIGMPQGGEEISR